MADEFQTAVCGGKWWSSTPTTFGPTPCSSLTNDMGTIGWPSDMLEMKASHFQDIQKPHHPATVSSGGTTMAMDSSLQMMGIDLSSSSTTDWNQDLLQGSGKTESNFHPMLQEELNQALSLDQQKDFPMSSVSYGYPSILLQTLFDSDSQPQPSQFDNPSMNYPSTQKLNEFSSSNYLHLSNNTPLWNASASALNGTRTSFFSSTKSQLLPSTFEEKLICPKLIAKHKNEEVRDLGLVVKKRSIEPEFKRPRIETPSPLPTFKVRKEKLGDRVTALQQLVSPFGKTDTASVLHEAIEYIKLLHNQVSVLSIPYMKNGASIARQQTPDKLKDTKEPKQDLRSRGLCLVPISSTFPVATETTADFWAPTFGGTFR